MNLTTIIGLLAGLLTTLSFLPQIRKIYLTHRTRDLSLSCYLILAAGLLLWITYGILMRQVAIILPNSIIFILCMYIILMKRKYG